MFDFDVDTNQMTGLAGLDSVRTDGDILQQLGSYQLPMSEDVETLDISSVPSGNSDQILPSPEVAVDDGETPATTAPYDPLTGNVRRDREAAIAPLNWETQSYESLIQSSPGLTKNNGGWTDHHTYPRMSGDVNGDGADDLIGFGGSKVYVALGNADGTFDSPVASTPTPGYTTNAGGWSNNNTYPRMSGDINGDGKDDIVGFGGSKVYVSFGQNDGTFGDSVSSTPTAGYTPGVGGWTDNNTYPRMLGDINGDGEDDIVGFGSSQIYASLSQGDGTFGDAIASTPSPTNGFTVNVGGWTDNNTYPRMLGDVNNDGKDDIIGLGSTNVFVSLSRGNGTFDPPVAHTPGLTKNVGGWTDNDNYPRVIGDVNGDNRDDLIGFGSSDVFVSLSGMSAPPPDDGPILDVKDPQYFQNLPQFYMGQGNGYATYGYGSSVLGNNDYGKEGNCTWYAYGRLKELGFNPDDVMNGYPHAYEWGNVLDNGALILGSGETPRLGDVAQWYLNGENHVAIVEKVENGMVTLSESAWSQDHDGDLDGDGIYAGDGTLHRIVRYSVDTPHRYIRLT